MTTDVEPVADLEPRAGALTHTRTPSGIEIAYHVKPKRKYEVRGPGDAATSALGDRPWLEVPSVTTMLGVLDKPALPWWGQGVGADGLRVLVEMQIISVGFNGTEFGFFLNGGDGHLLDTSELVDLLIKHKLTVNHVRDQAGDRGTAVHDALEKWAALGTVPDPNDYDWEQKGYVTGLAKFLHDSDLGGFASEMVEVTVASVQHGFAGRFDLLGRNERPMRVVTKVYPKWPDKYTVVPPSRLLVDLKTSKEIYPVHLLQLEAYEQGLIECGYGNTDARVVLHVTQDGRYEFRRARATFDMFLPILHTYNAMEEVKERMKL